MNKQKDEERPRKRKWYIVLLIIFLFTLLTIGTILVLGGWHWPVAKHKVSNGPKMVLISLDGFRFDMISYANTPHLAQLADDGVMCAMRPAYPSTTFPNHFTMITGLLPARHGIIGNQFLDPGRNEAFNSRDKKNTEDGTWLQDGEPIWNLLERDGGKAAVVQWCGAGTIYSGRKASYTVPYKKGRKPHEVTEKVLEFIKKNGTGASNLVIGYYPLIDSMSHKHGPDSPEEMDAIKALDREIGKIMQHVANMSNTNLLVLSDHGSATVSNSVDLVDLIPNYKNRVNFACCGPLSYIYPQPKEMSEMIEEAKQASKKYPGKISVYTRDEFPANWKFANNSRIPPILIQSELGVSVACDISDGNNGKRRPNAGDHGYDPTVYKEMQAIFIAKGPLFKSGTLSLSKGGIEAGAAPGNVDVYRVIANCLELPVRADLDSGSGLANRVLKSIVEP